MAKLPNEGRVVTDALSRRWSCTFYLRPHGEMRGECHWLGSEQLRTPVILGLRSDWLTMVDEKLAAEIMSAEARG